MGKRPTNGNRPIAMRKFSNCQATVNIPIASVNQEFIFFMPLSSLGQLRNLLFLQVLRFARIQGQDGSNSTAVDAMPIILDVDVTTNYEQLKLCREKPQ